jgi:uncharacterized membrane protein
VGVKLFSWIAGVFLAIGAIFFLRYSIDRGWLSPEVRMVMGFAAGVGLIVLCELKAARRYPVTANALDAAGIAILFSTFFAGHALWHLIATVTAFTLMALVTALAVMLSLRRDSVFIALLGLIGGFATPALLATGEDHPVGLFGYLLLLNAGLAWVAYRKKWAFLSVLSLIFTTLYQWGWVAKFLTDSKLGLAAGIFLAFPAVSVGALGLLGREEDGKSPVFGRTAAVGAALPLLFAVYLAAVPAYGSRWLLLFAFLFLVDAGLAALAVFRGEEALHLAAGLATLVVLLAWSANTLTPDLLHEALAVYVVFSIFYFFVPLAARHRPGAPAKRTGPAVYLGLMGHACLLFLATQRTLTVRPDVFLGAALALLTVVAWFVAVRGFGNLQVAALALASCAVTVWIPVAGRAPWPAAGIGAAGALAFWGVAGYVFSERKPFALAASVALFLAQAAAIAASLTAGSPPVHVHVAAHTLFVAALLGVAWATSWQVLAVLAVVPASLAAYGWEIARSGRKGLWREELLFGAALYALFIAYPLLLGKRAGKSREPYIAAVLASVSFFFLARFSLLEGGYRDVIGLLPLSQAALMGLLLLRLRGLGVPADENRPRLVLVSGALLAFVTVTIPVQLEKEWITLGWALLAAALAWLYGRLPHPGLLAWTSGLFAAVLVRLALNPAVLSYHPRAASAVFNWYFYTYGVPAAAFFAGARLLGKRDETARKLSRLLWAGGTVLLFLLLNIEIANSFSEGRRALTFRIVSGSLAEGLAYTLGWAFFAIALLAAGLVTKSRAVRIAALALLVVTILKCFLLDLASLGGLYRVASFVILAICLALVAVLLQRFVLAPQKEKDPAS